MQSFLDLAADQVDDFELTIQHEVGSCVVKSHLGDLGIIRHGIEVDDPQNTQEFTTMLCNVGEVGEADTRLVVATPSGQRLGYGFPLAALRVGTGIREGWPAKFAEVGFRKFVSLGNINRYSVFRTTAELRGEEFFLDELFSEEHVLFVFSNAGLQEAGLSDERLRLSLLEQQIQEVESHGKGFTAGDAGLENKNINLRIPRTLDPADVTIFCSLISQADKERFSVGSFLTYYQVIEYCIDKIFQIEVKKLPTLELDTWKLKESLANLTNEVSRIGILDQKYLSNTVRRSSFEDLKQECLQLLTNTGDPQEAHVSWFKALYKVRNMVVHNQMRFHRHAGKMELSATNKVLRRACMEALFSFSPPIEQ
ncbi:MULTISPECIES: hypothetical protein [unclassified Sinorhizobium]|uniref:hypothetical protein n=1 Tax=unclassified Sinorhizobium TaxID=2613772 RepID=UPI0024C3CA80|nr:MULTISPECIES: hypothetical protein [unclassified Sinorhizobium]MDK1378560.1 hypothetical protein [Sinorhizobium sp. 6-70]MDK1482917.1 hypothetical protein [Sinorhizobium sp. 6-117]